MTDKGRAERGIKGLTPKKRSWVERHLYDPKRVKQPVMTDAIGQLKLFAKPKVNADDVQRN